MDSIEYLRKMGFFEEHSNLTSEEIFERIKEKSIISIEKENWTRESVFKIDKYVASYDSKRTYSIDVEGPKPRLCHEDNG